MEVEPTPQTLRTIQDKFRQKQHFEAVGVPLPDFREIKCSKCAEGAGRAFGYPYMLKCKRWGGGGGDMLLGTRVMAVRPL